ncbi:MAG TPA: aminoacyl-tRNA hydrolase [Candidatus Limnocylindrales bacterium]|nr:aminoacyl-tRNA hydrolase [Candidatus Limnocylindrales bacterium]
MKLIVGLGNPGTQYAETRHNIGWLVLDRIADRAGWSGGRERDASRVVRGRLNGLDVTLAKPLTYMNDSGIAVRKLLAREHVPIHDMLVVCDDLALPFGRLRFREGGSAGTHNGLRSIIDELANEKFPRLRVGIGEPEGAHRWRGHVLGQFGPDERQRLTELLDAGADAVETWVREGTSKAANRFNGFELRPADEDRQAAPGDVDGPPDEKGIRRTRTGWRKTRPADEEGGPAAAAGRGRS